MEFLRKYLRRIYLETEVTVLCLLMY